MADDTKVGDFYGLLGMRVDEGSFGRANKLLSTVKTAVAAFVGFKVVQGIGNAIGDVVEMGGHLADTAQKTGVAAETLQEYSYGAGLAGVKSELLTNSLGKLNKGLAEAAATGKGPVAEGLKSIGIGLNDPAVKAQNLDEILLEVADKFAKMPDGPKKVAAAMNLFGKAGADLIPFLNQGGDGIEKLKVEARELGVVLSEDTVAGLDELGDNVDRLKAGWQGVKNQAVAAILPLLMDLMPGLIATMKDVVAWVKEHKEEIREFVATVGRGISYAIKGIIAVVQALAKIFKAVGTAIGQAIGFIVTKVQEVGRFFSATWDFIKTTARGLVDALVAVGTAIINAFNFVADKIRAAFKAVFDWIVEKIEWIIGKVKAVINDLDARAKRTLDKLGVAEEDQTTGAKAAATAADILIPGWGMINAATDDEAPQQSAPAAPGPTAMTTGVNVDVGGITVNPSPGMDERKLAVHVAEVVDERMASVFRHAMAEEGSVS